MRPRFAITAATILTGASVWICGATAATLRPAASEGQEQPAYSYVGTKKCKSCHLDVHKSWSKTKMGQAFETLLPEKAAEGKAKFGFDASKDYTQDETCLKCHTTGFGEPGGYAIPDPDDRRAVRKAKDFHGVGCESCHGPGSGYVPVFEEIDESKRSYTVDELYSVGMRKIDKAACVTCHNEESPTFNADDPFDFDKIMKEEEEAKEKDLRIHVHKPLKLRAE